MRKLSTAGDIIVNTVKGIDSEDAKLVQTQREWILTSYQNATLPTHAVNYLKAKVASNSSPVSVQDIDIEDMSRIGRNPCEADKSAMRRVIARLKDRVSNIDAELLGLQLQMNAVLSVFECLRDQTNKLCDVRSYQQAKLAKIKGLLSPFRGFPVELLIIIFGYAAAGRNSTPRGTTVLHLSRVCSQWRQIVLSLPNLWNRKTKEGTISLRHTKSDLLSLRFSTEFGLKNLRPYLARFKSIAPFHHRLSHIHIKTASIDLPRLLFFPGACELPLQSLAIDVEELETVVSKKYTHTLTCPNMSQFRIYSGNAGAQDMDLSHLCLPALTTVELIAGPLAELDTEMLLSTFLPPISHSFQSIRKFSLLNILCETHELVRCFSHMSVLEELVLMTTGEEFMESVLPSISAASRRFSSNKIGNIISLSIALVYTIADGNNVVKSVGALIVSWMEDKNRKQSLRGVSLYYLMDTDMIEEHIEEVEYDLEEFQMTLEQREGQEDGGCGFAVFTGVKDLDEWDMEFYDFSDW